MRTFSSYGPISIKTNYYVPRTELIERTYEELIGIEQEEGGHYITVWAPRQTGKTWALLQIIKKIRSEGQFEVQYISMGFLKDVQSSDEMLEGFVDLLSSEFERRFTDIDSWKKISNLFTSEYFNRPLILILDEFDALEEEFVNQFANVFREMHITNKRGSKKKYVLHGLALIGVRSVLGIENVKCTDPPPVRLQRLFISGK